MLRIGLYGRLLELEKASFIQQLIDALHENQCKLLIYEPFLPHLQNKIKFRSNYETFKTSEDLEHQVDVIIGVGGDGTILDTVHLVATQKIPVLGINFGRLGFLATIGAEDIQLAIHALLNEVYEIEERTLLELDANVPLFTDRNLALNEFTLHKKDNSSMVTIHAYLNGEFLNSYWADGLIISTPTGSTGYSLSCGGPVVMPQSSNFIITPVAPHNLSVRPLIVSDDSVLTFEIEGRAENFMCTLDSRSESIDENVRIAIKRSKLTFKLIRLPDSNFLYSLRSKLMWGHDKRVK